ncbi:polymorphic toxin-type HINT domain-containing protein [Streptomyces sp. NBC_01506]|uniref:polymorphic toxin-type HINT domain-containing protein n=1 Tax=Streptomyces sp. NBC_01506 TaxID=2903887 RepID=UPI00386CE1F9
MAAVVMAGVLPATAATTAVAAGKDPGVDLPELKQPAAVPVKPVAAGGKKLPDAAKANAWKSPKVTWPAAGSAEVTPQAGKARRAGALPVSVAGLPAASGAAKDRSAPDRAAAGELPGTVKVTMAGRDAALAAGVDGVLLSARRADSGTRPASAEVRVDYSSFRGAYGGDWAARLRLVELPACALTTPDRPECRTQKPLSTTNDTRAATLSAPVALKPAAGTASGSAAAAAAAPTVLAAAAEAAGPTGDYKATSLEPSGSWSAGGASGSFNWSQPIGVPGVPGGLQPSVDLSYSSQSVDGRTAASNNQPSWIGDGWSWEPGYVERRYKSCEDDKKDGTNTTRVGDLCWYNNNVTLSLGGKSTELVYEEGKGWHPATDSGEKVEKLTGASNGDGGTAGVDGAGEHWKITTSDGTQYFFGLNRLPGWSDNGSAADDPVTNSTSTVPVFGNQSGEPCYKAAFADAWCRQAWRWQLDHVVDPRGNAMAYYWKSETNNYGRNVDETTGKATVTSYDRGSYLDHIDYGLRAGAAYTTKAMGQVHFGVDERCLTTCSTFDETNAKNWPDVPFDLHCKAAATECKSQFSPSFWSRKRLTSITTKVLTGGAYKDVDSWSLKQGFPASGDGISTPMWLESITRTGKAGGSVTLPPVTFAGEQKANRVDKLGDGLAPFIRLRVYQITTETGGTIAATYSQPDCTATTLPAKDETNTSRCYHFKWAFEGETAKDDWFNSYVVTQVTEGDNLAATPDKVTSYAYLDGAAWSKSTDEFAKAEDRTYSVSRGYGRVQIRTGAGFDARTLTEGRYFRGLDGKEVKDSTGAIVTDREQFAGKPRETLTYNGDDTSQLVSATSYTPWRSTASATRTRTGLPDLEARMTDTQNVSTRTTTSTGTRTTKTATEFDDYGMVKSISETGDTARTGDEKCTTSTYARNTATRLLNSVSRTETVAKECGAAVTRPEDVIDDVRFSYDNGAHGATPSKGLVTKTERINGKGDGYDTSASVPSTCGTSKTELCYDAYGRALAATDAYGKTTTTAYTPATGEAPTQTLVTNPLGHTTTTVMEPLRGRPTQVTDANNKVTTTAYDALGRVTKVWIPTRSAATYPDSPNHVYDYLVRRDGPIVTTTKSLTHDAQYQTSYTFSDGLLRPVQTQDLSPDRSGRLVSEMFYDTRGLVWRDSGVYYADGPPEPVAVTGQELKYPSSSDTLYDGAGRVTAVIARKFGDETKRTTTSYTGDTTTVIPPKGGTATTEAVDALGRTTEVKQYTNADRTQSQSLTYTHDKRGLLEQVTDPSGARWTYTYDVRGRQTKVDDPDKGVTTTVYDKGDRATDTTDVARGITLHTNYDDLGRETSLTKGATTLASWAYDTPAKGQLSKATRYIGGKAYESAITSYNSLYQPVLTQVTIPDSEGALAGTYKWTTAYNVNTGQVTRVEQPAMGDLGAERVSSTYTPVTGLLSTVGVPDAALVSGNTYDHYGRNTRQEYGEFGEHLWTTSEYDEHTGALTRAYTDREVAPQRIDDTKYAYDPAGNVTSVATAYGQDATRTTDTQCFGLDALRRITEAWTNTGEQCAGSPSTSVVGGQDAYWTSYTFDAVGNRRTETQHKTPSGPTADTVRTYAAPEAGTHNLPKVTQTGTNAHEETFTYDGAGNTETRKTGPTAESQSLKWDDEGHLASVTQGAVSSSYLYDTEGQRMLRKDSTGTTLYLPAGNELHLAKNGTVTGTRYYTAGAEPIAVRKGGKLTLLFSDHHGTGTTQVTSDAAQQVTRRKSTIFGAPRGTQPADWAGDKGFVGGTKDTDTGLVHLGAREYDPTIGRFISVDPLMDLTDPESLNGYTYAGSNPVTSSDPTGLCRPESCGAGVAIGGTGTGKNNPVRYVQAKNAPDPKVQFAVGSGINGDGSVVGKNTVIVYPTIVIPKGWDGQNEFTQRFYRFLDTARNTNGTLPRFLDDPTNPDYNPGAAEGQLGHWALWACKQTGDCPKGLEAKFGSMAAGFMLEAAAMSAVGGPRAGGLGRCDGPNSFIPETQVLLADGTTKSIEDVRVGDKVLATDPKTGKTSARTVTAEIKGKGAKDLVRVTIDTDGKKGTKTASVTATDGHPFWVPELNEWITATALEPGQWLRTSAGTHVQITAVARWTQQATVYNLTVADVHTYYVLAGATPVLVHNSNCTNWAANSVKTWGHTFKTHGAGAKNTKALTDRARSTGNQQGQWLDNDGAADFLKGLHVEGAGPRSVRIPDGLGQVIMPDGSIVQARAATIVPSPNGLYKTGFPIIGPN